MEAHIRVLESVYLEEVIYLQICVDVRVHVNITPLRYQDNTCNLNSF